MSRIFRLSLRSFCSSSVSPVPSSTTLPASGSTLKAIGRANFDRRGKSTAAPSRGQRRRPVDHLPGLLVELLDAGPAGAGDGLVGAGDHAAQPGHVVQRLQHRHGGHGRAVRVGDDALGDRVQEVGVDLGDDERHVRVHAPGRGVVDDDGPGGGEAGRQLRDEAAPAEKRASSRPVRSAVAASSTTTSVPFHGSVRPADRAEAK